MRTLSPEHQLIDYLGQLRPYAHERQAVHIHTSRFSSSRQRSSRLKAASHSFDTLISTMAGRLFVLGNDDIVYVYKENFAGDVAGIVKRLELLFSDPLGGEYERENGAPSLPFSERFRLGNDYDRFLERMDRLAYEARVREVAATRRSREAAARIALFGAGKGTALTPAVLANIEATLEQADLSSLLRRQTVCFVENGKPPHPLFEEAFISISELRQTLLPQIDLMGNRWLFQYLTESLDRRVLSLLHQPEIRATRRSLSLNINVNTILSKEFLAFDAAIGSEQRHHTILELQKTDIFSDLLTYSFARDFVHERGYRICIDGLDHRAFPFVNRVRLGADLIKLQWQPELRLQTPFHWTRLSDLVRRCGADRTILCHCDQPEAVSYGQSLGLSLFQGHHIGDMMAAARTHYKKQKRVPELQKDS